MGTFSKNYNSCDSVIDAHIVIFNIILIHFSALLSTNMHAYTKYEQGCSLGNWCILLEFNVIKKTTNNGIQPFDIFWERVDLIQLYHETS